MPPVVPRPGIEGGLIGSTIASLIEAKAFEAAAMTPGACNEGSLRSSKSFRPTKKTPALFLVCESRML